MLTASELGALHRISCKSSPPTPPARARTGNLHPATSQIREAKQHLLQGFAQALDQLDGITDPSSPAGTPGAPVNSLDPRVSTLRECEAPHRHAVGNPPLVRDPCQFDSAEETGMKSLPSRKPTGERLADLIEPVAMRLAITILLLSTVVPLILIS